MIYGLSPLDDLTFVLEAVTISVQAVRGLTVEQAIQTLEMGAQIVAFGAPLVISGSEFQAAGDNLEDIWREIVRKVKG
jgi:hypothetical protein